jgi:hypothetical protein
MPTHVDVPARHTDVKEHSDRIVPHGDTPHADAAQSHTDGPVHSDFRSVHADRVLPGGGLPQ